jgi:uncharacterized protein (TIGR03067 family)
MPADPDRSVSPSFAPNLVTALVHAGVWVTVILSGLSLVGYSKKQFDDFQMKLPYMTETCIQLAMFALDYWLIALTVLAIALIADAMILHWLSGSETRRLFREAWSGVVIALPIAGLCVATTAIMLPYLKLTEGLTKTNAARGTAVAAELQRFAGEWVQVFEDEGGKPTVRPAGPPVQFAVRRDRFNWNDDAGSLTLGPTRRPPTIDLFYAAGPFAGQLRSGIYRFVGDRLQIVLSPPNAPGDQLPISVEQRGPNDELFIFQPKPKP